MDGWNTILSFWGPAYFQERTISFREGVKEFVHKKWASCKVPFFKSINQGVYFFLGTNDDEILLYVCCIFLANL